MTNNPDSKAPEWPEFPDFLWAEMDDEVIIHNGRHDLEGLIATGLLRKYVPADSIPKPSPQQAAKVLLESRDTDLAVQRAFSEISHDDRRVVLANVICVLAALSETKDG